MSPSEIRFRNWQFSQLPTKKQFMLRVEVFLVDVFPIKLSRRLRYLHILPFLSDSWDIFAGEQIEFKRIEDDRHER